MPKPIFLIGLPSKYKNEKVNANLQSIFENVGKELSGDYYVLVYIQEENDDFDFKCFYEKDFNDIRYEELKSLILNSLT